MRGANSLTWGHVVIRRTIVNPQSIRLHFCYLQFHSGEMWAPPSLRIHHSSIGKLTVGPAVFVVRYLHNSHKAPYLPPFPPPPPPTKKCVIISPGYHSPSQEKLKTMLIQNFGGQIRCIMEDVQVAKTGLNISFL